MRFNRVELGVIWRERVVEVWSAEDRDKVGMMLTAFCVGFARVIVSWGRPSWDATLSMGKS